MDHLTGPLLVAFLSATCTPGVELPREEFEIASGMCIDCIRHGGEVQCRDGCTSPLAWVRIDVGQPITQLVGGIGDRFCGVTARGSVYCWGCNQEHFRCESLESVRLTPLDHHVRRLAFGVSHTCALTRSNEVWCWGLSVEGQLGWTSPRPQRWIDATEARRIDLPPGRYTDMVAAGWSTCVLRDDRGLYCWGTVGIGEAWRPHRALDDVRSVAAQLGICAIVGDSDALHCTPRRSDRGDTTVAFFIDTGIPGVRQLAMGLHACIADREGRIRCREHGVWRRWGHFPGQRLMSTAHGVCLVRGSHIEACNPADSLQRLELGPASVR